MLTNLNHHNNYWDFKATLTVRVVSYFYTAVCLPYYTRTVKFGEFYGTVKPVK
jgi:hypothetical protein